MSAVAWWSTTHSCSANGRRTQARPKLIPLACSTHHSKPWRNRSSEHLGESHHLISHHFFPKESAMNNHRARLFLFAATFAAVSGIAEGQAPADEYPSRTIK